MASYSMVCWPSKASGHITIVQLDCTRLYLVKSQEKVHLISIISHQIELVTGPWERSLNALCLPLVVAAEQNEWKVKTLSKNKLK